MRDLITTTLPFSVAFLNVSDLPIKTHRVSDLSFSPLLYEFKYDIQCLFRHSTLPSIRVRSFGGITYFRLYDERVHLFRCYHCLIVLLMMAIQVMICSTTQNVLISATLSAFLLLSNAFVPIALHQYFHIFI